MVNRCCSSVDSRASLCNRSGERMQAKGLVTHGMCLRVRVPGQVRLWVQARELSRTGPGGTRARDTLGQLSASNLGSISAPRGTPGS
jgi:hypothetical protein